jgi:hypothetical protein
VTTAWRVDAREIALVTAGRFEELVPRSHSLNPLRGKAKPTRSRFAALTFKSAPGATWGDCPASRDRFAHGGGWVLPRASVGRPHALDPGHPAPQVSSPYRQAGERLPPLPGALARVGWWNGMSQRRKRPATRGSSPARSRSRSAPGGRAVREVCAMCGEPGRLVDVEDRCLEGCCPSVFLRVHQRCFEAQSRPW